MTFFDNYTYRTKNFALLIIGVLLVLVSYKKAIKPTMELNQYSNELTEKVSLAENSDAQIKMKQRNIFLLNSMLGEENNSVEKVQQAFLNFFDNNASNIGVQRMDAVLKYEHPDFEINTHPIVLKGNYLSTLKFLHEMEVNFHLAKILNVEFELKKENSSSTTNLYTTLLIQNFNRK